MYFIVLQKESFYMLCMLCVWLNQVLLFCTSFGKGKFIEVFIAPNFIVTIRYNIALHHYTYDLDVSDSLNILLLHLAQQAVSILKFYKSLVLSCAHIQ